MLPHPQKFPVKISTGFISVPYNKLSHEERSTTSNLTQGYFCTARHLPGYNYKRGYEIRELKYFNATACVLASETWLIQCRCNVLKGTLKSGVHSSQWSIMFRLPANHDRRRKDHVNTRSVHSIFSE
jgi:hypothetical protein